MKGSSEFRTVRASSDQNSSQDFTQLTTTVERVVDIETQSFVYIVTCSETIEFQDKVRRKTVKLNFVQRLSCGSREHCLHSLRGHGRLRRAIVLHAENDKQRCASNKIEHSARDWRRSMATHYGMVKS